MIGWHTSGVHLSLEYALMPEIMKIMLKNDFSKNK